ncbi:hypothetical protein TNCV_3543561 [Trichonephila clavipes]|nr:hypothetical protein TNCV_3543561 [Trichonephila clavipes]
MSCGFVRAVPSLHLSVLRLIPVLEPNCVHLSKRAWRFRNAPQAMKVHPEGDQTAGHKGDEDLGQSIWDGEYPVVS